MSTWLITGASRGIGLEYVRQIVERGDTVFAAVRSPDKAVELRELQEASAQGSIEIVELDVCNPQTIIRAAKVVDSILQGRGLDYLISNAGISKDAFDKPLNIKTDDLIEVFQTNVIGCLLVYQSFVSLLERSKRPGGPVLVNISSELGSIGKVVSKDPIQVSAATYSISKAALNMLTVKQASEKSNIIVISMAPGWLKTDMGGPNAIYEVDFSVTKQIKLVVAATHADSGKFKEFTGDDYLW